MLKIENELVVNKIALVEKRVQKYNNNFIMSRVFLYKKLKAKS